MTPVRRHAILRRVREITLSSTISIALAGIAVVLPSCNNNESSDERSEARFSRGVRTFITETAPGTFKITDEEQIDPSHAGAIVHYYDGHRDTLSVDAAKRLVDNDQSTRTYLDNPSAYQSHHHNGLANALLWGSLGYMLGRSTAPQYRDDERRYGAGVYTNSGLYERANRVGENVRSSRVISRGRPSGGRSGFFGGRSRSFSG